MTKPVSVVSAHVGRRIAIRIAGVAIATSGLALLSVGTLGSPLSTGHAKLVSAVQDPEDCGGDHAPVVKTAEGEGENDSDCCSKDLTLRDGAPVALSAADNESGDNENEGDDDSSCSTNSPTSTPASTPTSSSGNTPASSNAGSTTTGVQAATTPVVPKTGADIEVGLGLGLVVTGGGMALAATRRGRRKN